MKRTVSTLKKDQGFTLLEVLIAITLTALVLGNLFALQSQSKRLSFKAQANLLSTIHKRAYLNAAWLSDRTLDSYLDKFSDSGLSVGNKKRLKKPEEQTSPLKYSLESFDIVDAHNEVILSSVRVKETTVSRQ